MLLLLVVVVVEDLVIVVAVGAVGYVAIVVTSLSHSPFTSLPGRTLALRGGNVAANRSRFIFVSHTHIFTRKHTHAELLALLLLVHSMLCI